MVPVALDKVNLNELSLEAMYAKGCGSAAANMQHGHSQHDMGPDAGVVPVMHCVFIHLIFLGWQLEEKCLLRQKMLEDQLTDALNDRNMALCLLDERNSLTSVSHKDCQTERM